MDTDIQYNNYDMYPIEYITEDVLVVVSSRVVRNWVRGMFNPPSKDWEDKLLQIYSDCLFGELVECFPNTGVTLLISNKVKNLEVVASTQNYGNSDDSMWANSDYILEELIEIVDDAIATTRWAMVKQKGNIEWNKL